MDGATAAVKLHPRIRPDRNVHANPLRPVIVRVDMGDCFAFSFDEHEARAADRRRERPHHLLYVGATLENWSRQHRALRGIAREITSHRDERNRPVPDVALGMRPPLEVTECVELREKAICVESVRQSYEFCLELQFDLRWSGMVASTQALQQQAIDELRRLPIPGTGVSSRRRTRERSVSEEQTLKFNADWLPPARPFVISGPCAAETEEQTLETARRLRKLAVVNLFRAGVWKPRTRPGHYEGAGEAGLDWLVRVRDETGFKVTTEVANSAHVEACMRHGIDALWIGARTTTSPFAVQEIAEALRGAELPVLVKNPPSPDLELWLGALERLDRAGVKRLGAVHRGFSVFDKGPFRNAPTWDIAIELMTRVPGLPMICDPSHICGNRDLIALVAQKALDLEMDGLMIESHVDPDRAWSDAKQQLKPEALGDLLAGLAVRETSSLDHDFEAHLEELRRLIDSIDDDVLQKLASRMAIVEKIGLFKQRHNVTILQVERWEKVIRSRSASASSIGLRESFVNELLRLIHREAIQLQERVMNDTKIDV